MFDVLVLLIALGILSVCQYLHEAWDLDYAEWDKHRYGQDIAWGGQYDNR